MYSNLSYSAARSSAQNKASALLFDNRNSSKNTNLDDDDETVITSNLLNKSVYSGSYLRDSSQSRKSSRQLLIPINKKRAPKVAALIMASFFVIGGICFVSQSIGELVSPSIERESRSNASTSISIETNGTDKSESDPPLPLSMEALFEEMSKPNTDKNGNAIRVPSQLANLADLNAPLDKNKEVPILWHIPRSGGSNFKQIASFCYDLTVASEVGPKVDPVAATQNILTVVVDADSGAKFLNVDTNSLDGLERAKKLHVASYPGLGLIATPYIYLASDALFNAVNRGRLIVMFRHPIDRAVSMYYYLRDKTGINGAQIGDTLELYAKSAAVENNWMTRFLTNKLGGELTPDDEATAKEVLRTKCLVGLLSRKAESMRRFKAYFDWKPLDTSQENLECEEKHLHWGWTGKNRHERIEVGSDTWNLLKEQNSFDIRVYEYAVKLFELQGKTIFSK